MYFVDFGALVFWPANSLTFLGLGSFVKGGGGDPPWDEDWACEGDRRICWACYKEDRGIRRGRMADWDFWMMGN